jgi:hypothetical protein
MSLLFSPFESYFDRDGKPTAAGQQLLARIGQLFDTADTSIGALHGLPDGGADGYVLTKASAADYDAEWVEIAGAGSGSFSFDDGDAAGGGVEFELDEGGA